MIKNKNIWLKRNLLEWSWQLNSNKTIELHNKKHSASIILDKVRLISFVKFAISALDKMRIEEGKQFRIKANKIKEENKNKIIKIRTKKRNSQKIYTQAKIEK